MEGQVLVFSTSVQSHQQVKALQHVLDRIAGNGNWNFALDDCDKILRVKSGQINAQTAIRILQDHGYECMELD